jgi:hypothetical protein
MIIQNRGVVATTEENTVVAAIDRLLDNQCTFSSYANMDDYQ